MDDKQQIEALYKQMYQAMIAKDTSTNQVYADKFDSAILLRWVNRGN